VKVIPQMHDFLSGLSAEGVAEFNRLSSLRTVPAGTLIYRQGDESDEIYQLVEGAVRLCNYLLDGREMVTAEFRAGDCFGEMGMIDQLPRVSHAITTQDSVLRILERRGFEQLLRKFPELNQLLLLTLCRRLRALYALREETSGLSLHQRVARAVLRLAHSQGVRDAEDNLFISISQEEFGHMLGASRQSVNRELRVLAREGVVDLRYGRIYVTDLATLDAQYEYLMGLEQITAGYGSDP
jgi:CRP/FNR family cyclic AMP-dependent transcriptional regulator